MERGASAHRCLAPRLATPRHGGVLHVRPGLQRGSLPLSAVCAEYGTNNFPDCSNMCHEATSVGLPQSIGVGKGTVTLEDFDHCDALFCIGHNPGTNHPRMLTTLREVSKPRRADYRLQPATRARAGAVHRAPKSHRNADTELNADRLDLLSCEGWRRHRRAEGDDEDPRDAGCEKPRGRRPGCSRP